ncbi:MAG: Polysaccharide biosynthesis protein [Syntrophorhabdaceae bacterium PtaU1.Bin034]|nr:MAG: Polysaccharide biosynthesis protein [Syntrophorhabdaceae bacterium PtaU1.Bin034]
MGMGIPKAFSQTFVYWMGRMGARSLSLLLLPLYTAHIAPVEWGALALLITSGDLVALVVGLQLTNALYSHWARARSEEERRSLTGLVLACTALVPGVALLPVYLFSREIASLLGDHEYQGMVMLYALAIHIGAIVGVVQAEMRLREETRRYAAMEIALSAAIAGVSAVLVAGFGLGIRGMVWGNFAAFTAVAAVTLPRMLRRARLNLDLNKLRSLVSFSLPLIPSSAAMAGVHNLDRYLLQAYLGAQVVGIYSMGYKFGQLINLAVLGPFLLYWEPKSYQIALEPKAEERLGRMFTLLAALLVFFVVALSGMAREVVQLMTDERYWEAYRVVPPVVISYAVFGLDSVARVGMLAAGRTRTVLVVVLVSLAVNIGGNLWLIPRWGMLAAAWMTLGTFVVLLAGDMLLSHRSIPIRYEKRNFLILIAVGALVWGLQAGIHLESLWASLAAKLTVVTIYPLALWAAGILRSKNDGQETDSICASERARSQ